MYSCAREWISSSGIVGASESYMHDINLYIKKTNIFIIWNLAEVSVTVLKRKG